MTKSASRALSSSVARPMLDEMINTVSPKYIGAVNAARNRTATSAAFSNLVVGGGSAAQNGEAQRMPDYSRIAASALFLASGTLHFAKPQMFTQIVPPALPNPAALVAISGAAELTGSAALWFRWTRRPAALGLIALLLAVFPANVYMAIEHERFAEVAPGWLLFVRLPVQALLIAWMWTLRS